jgi:putative FmdB family regulatory protein
MLYDYKCVECDKILEVQRTVAARDDELLCPKCMGEMKRVVICKVAKALWKTECPTASGGR